MSGDIVTRWGLVLRLDAAPAEASPGEPPRSLTAEELFAEARREELDRCPVLGSFLRSESAVVRVAGGPTAVTAPAAPAEASPAPDADPVAADTLVAVSVVEVRPSSFDMEAGSAREATPPASRSTAAGRWSWSGPPPASGCRFRARYATS